MSELISAVGEAIAQGLSQHQQRRKKGNYQYWYSSNAKNKSGSIDIFSNKKEAISHPQGSGKTPLYDYHININQVGGLIFSWGNYAYNSTSRSKDFNIDVTVWDKPSENFFFNEAKKKLGLGVPSTSIEPVFPEATILLPLPKGFNLLGKSFNTATGGVKQWFRFGPSYSIEGEFKTFSLRWGAGGKFWKKIGNTTLQNWNKEFRQTKLPFGGWRSADPGHFHLWKRK